jgi:hypothetical protein
MVADTNELACMGEIELPLLMGTQYVTVRFQVVPQLLHDMIIGRDCLLRYKARIDFSADILQMDLTEGLFIDRQITLPPRTNQMVHVKLRDKQSDLCTGAYVVPCKNGRRAPLMSAQQAVKIRNGKGQVFMSNKGTQPIILQAGEKIAVAKQADPHVRDYSAGNSVSERRPLKYSEMEYREAIDEMDFSQSVLTTDQVRQVKRVVWKERSLLSVKDDIGKLKNFQHKIKLKDSTPFSAAPYRLSPAARGVMRKELAHHLEQGAIEPRLSEYNSPCILVKKEPYRHLPIDQAKCRLVVDLRALNQRVVKEKYCIPHVVETVSQLEKDSLRYMSLLDLTKGFNQIEISPESRHLVTFRTDGLGSYALNRLPMGYVNASEVFQMCMERIVPTSLRQYVTIYVDDILITTPTFEKHLEVLEKLLNVLNHNGLTVQISKSKICQKKLQFLGYVLTADGVQIRQDKGQAIAQAPRPKTPTQVRSFLGSLSYNRRFIKDFATLARPLHKLTQKDGDFQWTEQCEQSFTALKQALMTAPILRPIDGPHS